MNVRIIERGWKNIYKGPNRVHRVTGGLIDDEQEGFREGKLCIDQIFTLKQIGEKA